ncbi:MAG: hypothetical protein K2N13_07720 [Paraprevotella sp.]|nr:hypothetical protein [Paraprevotella sp.]
MCKLLIVVARLAGTQADFYACPEQVKKQLDSSFSSVRFYMDTLFSSHCTYEMRPMGSVENQWAFGENHTASCSEKIIVILNIHDN